MEFKGTKLFNVDYHTTMNLPYKYTISDIQETVEEAEANALLISKAPEMLKMLKETFQLTDKIQMPTEFEIAQIRNKLFNLIKEATTI